MTNATPAHYASIALIAVLLVVAVPAAATGGAPLAPSENSTSEAPPTAGQFDGNTTQACESGGTYDPGVGYCVTSGPFTENASSMSANSSS